MVCILHNLHCFLLLLVLLVPLIGITLLILWKIWCHAMGVCLTLFPALSGCLDDSISRALWVYVHVAWLNMLAVEPGWLSAVYQGQ